MNLPSGFKYTGISCGIKPSGNADLALVVADRPVVASGVYTQNIVRAASIDWNRQVTPTDHLRAVVINSGNANACTGQEGFKNNQKMAIEVANQLDANPGQVCVLSTGVIGHQLPMDVILPGIKSAAEKIGPEQLDFELASQAILTTDNGTKTAFREFEVEGRPIRICGMAKGAGMIGPNMATMLAVITTDAKLTPISANDILTRVVNRSFNCISVEGHTSTNDAVVLMASGDSEGDMSKWPAIKAFTDELTDLCIELAKKIPSDGEGATHLIDIEVSGAATDEEADKIARSIAMSNLVKTAITGSDPNWGRIVSAAGLSGIEFAPEHLSLSLNGSSIFEKGQPLSFDAAKLSQSIKDQFETQIAVSVGMGAGQAQHWTSDLTVQYVQFNSEYTT
jgi:glutamate N-acetyltransferase/amino-acid N-acetyltransferase